MQLTLRQIEVFRAVMRAQTLVAAASQLKIAQPTVTKTIRRIEDLLRSSSSTGRRQAHSHRRSPADPGGGRPRLRAVEKAIGRAARIARSEEGVFRFGASPSLGRVLIPRVIAAMVRESTRAARSISTCSRSAQVVDYLVSGPGEGAVTFFPITHGIVQSTIVGTGRLVALVPRAFSARLEGAATAARTSLTQP